LVAAQGAWLHQLRWPKRTGREGQRTHVKGGDLVKEEVDGGAPAVKKKKEDGEGVLDVICYTI
jgi:hypothetical protein